MTPMEKLKALKAQQLAAKPAVEPVTVTATVSQNNLPRSFGADGFFNAEQARVRRFMPGLKRPGLMIGTDGESNTGKTEFAISCPGPGIVLCVDRGFDGMLDNPHPPASRRSDFAYKAITPPLATQAVQNEYLLHWQAFYADFKKALANPDVRTIVIDGDSDTWELQRLAEFGRLTQIPSIMYTNVNAARRAMIARAWDSGKTIISTNKIKAEYAVKRDDEGNPVLKDGKEVREKTGDMVRQGFDDQDYLWQIQLRHLYQPPRINKVTGAEVPQQWGIRIMKCKPRPELAGSELWGKEACFAGLVQLVYEDTPLEAWGL